MNYDDIVSHAENLSYRDKLRLAQLLIQLARKEEEEQNPEKRADPTGQKAQTFDPELVAYVAERLQKLKPAKKPALLNSIGAMFQFQGGISEGDKETIVAALVQRKVISIDQNNRVSFVA